MDINTWTFSGRLVKDATASVAGKNATSVVHFTVANNINFGEKQKSTFVNVSLWGKLGQSLLPYLVKGKTVAITGSLTQEESFLNVTAKDVILLSDAKQAASKNDFNDVDDAQQNLPTF